MSLVRALARNVGTRRPTPVRPFNWAKSPSVGESENSKGQKPRGAE